MSGNVGYATLQVIASMKGVAAGVQKELGASSPVAKKAGEKAGKEYGNGMSSAAKTAVKAIAGTVVAEKAFDFFKDSIKDADAYRTIANLTTAAIKSTGGAANVTSKDVAEMSEKLSLQDGVSKGVAQSTANMVLHYNAIKNVGANKIFDETTQAALNLSAATGVSATGAAKQLGKALQSPATSLSALTRSGITFTSQQAKQIQAMAKSGNLLGAQNAILKQVNTSYGGAAAAAATPMAKLKNVVNELQLSIGQALIPVMDKLANVGVKAFTWAQEHKTTVKVLAVGIGVLVAAMAVEKITKWTTAMKESTVVTKLWTAAQWLFDAAVEADPLVLIITGLVALGAALVIAYQKSATFRAIVQDAFSVVMTIGKDLFDWFIVMPAKAFMAVYTGLKTAWNAVIGFLKTWGPVALAVVLPFIGIPVLIWQHFGKIKGWLAGVWSEVKTDAKNFVNDVVGFIEQIPSKISGLAGKVLTAGKSLMSSLFDGIKDALSATGSFVTNLGKTIVNAIVSAINFALHLPLKLPKINTHIPGIGKVGGQTLLPAIPKLAKGGMTTGPTTALIGDNRSGNEVVMPMDSPKTVQLMANAMIKAGAGQGAGTVQHNTFNITDTSGNPESTAAKTARRLAALGKA